jgi:DNA-binding response OmpR family regulator
MKILVVEDHPKLRENIKKMCEMAHFTTETAIHGVEAIEKIRVSQYDCIILDMNMPLMGGREFLSKLREHDKETSVLILTSNSLTEDKVDAFDIGADDYLTKPFDVDELIARIRALGRRKGKQTDNKIQIGDILVDITHSKVYKNEETIELSAKEYKIIAYLLEYIGAPKSKEMILEAVWGERE